MKEMFREMQASFVMKSAGCLKFRWVLMRTTILTLHGNAGSSRLKAISISWDITLCSLLKFNRRFGGTCHLHLHDRMERARNQHGKGTKQSQKMEMIWSSETSVVFQQTTLRFIPKHRNLHNHSRENLKSYRTFCTSINISIPRNRYLISCHRHSILKICQSTESAFLWVY
jgi:hypothetical protein